MPQRSLSSTSEIPNSRMFHPSHPTLGNHEKHPKPFSCFIFCLPRPFPPHAWEPWSTQTLFHASFWAFLSPSHPTLRNHEKHPNPFSCFIFDSQALPTPLWGTMTHATPFSCFIFGLPKPFPQHSWEPFWIFPSPSHRTLVNHGAPNPPFHASFCAFPDPSQTLPTPRLGTMKRPNPFSCFILSLALPTRLLGTMRNTQTPFHASFLAFPSPAHLILGNHEARNPFFMRHFSLPKPFPQHSWEPLWTFPNPSHPTLGSHEAPKPLFMLHFFAFPGPSHHAWEPWSMRNTRTPFHVSFFAFPSPSHPTLGNHAKHPNPFSCFIFGLLKPFPQHSWESWETLTPVFMLHF